MARRSRPASGDRRLDRLLHDYHTSASGNFHTRTLRAAIAVMGVARVLFSPDHPYETMNDAANWFDAADINDDDREKIGHRNARRLFPRRPEHIGLA